MPVQGMGCNLCDARVAEDISLHAERNGKAPLLPLAIIGALLQSMFWKLPDIALYGALELKFPPLTGRICRDKAEPVLVHHSVHPATVYILRGGTSRGLHASTRIAVLTAAIQMLPLSLAPNQAILQTSSRVQSGGLTALHTFAGPQAAALLQGDRHMLRGQGSSPQKSF